MESGRAETLTSPTLVRVQPRTQAGCVFSAVGSLSLAQLRLSRATQASTILGALEILSLSGTH